MSAETPSGLSSLRAPTSEDIDALARAAFERLPASFQNLSDGLVIQVIDFPDDETLKEMGAESEFDLLGLFHGRGLAQRMRRERTDAVNEALEGLAPADRRLLEEALPALEELAEQLKERRP